MAPVREGREPGRAPPSQRAPVQGVAATLGTGNPEIPGRGVSTGSGKPVGATYLAVQACQSENTVSDDPLAPLLHRIAGGDRDAFRTLYRDVAPKLAGVLTRILGNRAEVEDAVQEVFVKIWQRASQFSPDRGSAMGWLIAVARHHALDRLRARPERQGLRAVEGAEDPLAMVADTAPGVESGLIAQGEARRILDCLDSLPPDRASALRGAYLQGLSYQELATRHGLPLNTLRTWLRRGLLQLRECMEP